MKAEITSQSLLAGQENSQELIARSTFHSMVNRMRKIFRVISNGNITELTLVYPLSKLSLNSRTLTTTLLMLIQKSMTSP